MNSNVNITCEKYDVAKTVFRGNFIVLNVLIREQSLKINELSTEIKRLGGKPTSNPN